MRSLVVYSAPGKRRQGGAQFTHAICLDGAVLRLGETRWYKCCHPCLRLCSNGGKPTRGNKKGVAPRLAAHAHGRAA